MVQASVDEPWSVDGHAAGRALEPYVSRLFGDWLRTTPHRTHRRVEGTMVFADISGFTRLTERLARLGKVGSEDMSDALDVTFTELLGVADADGADLVKWGGDAVLLLFHGDDHAERACRAAFRMRARLRVVGRLTTSAGQVRLRMSVGVHSGAFDFFLVGDPARHRELLVCGPDVTTVVETEAVAGAGEIAVAASTCALLDPDLLGQSIGAASRLLRREPSPSRWQPEVRPADTVDLSVGLPVAIRQHLLQRAGEAEHRDIAVGFVSFAGTDDLLAREGPDATGEALDACIRNVAESVADHKVTFLETDVAPGGGKILLIAGAPVSAGHDGERMLRAARQIVERAGRLPLRVGVTLGHVFSGDFGPPFRRTFSVKGDAVNLAARLVARADAGQVLATVQVPALSQSLFDLRALPPFLVKGKARPVDAVDVGPLLDDAAVATRPVGELVGRDGEVALLSDAVAGVRARRGGFVDIVGEPGLGKSRLLDEVREMADGLTVLSVTSVEYESSTPYHTVRTLLRNLLGIRRGTGQSAVRDRLVHRVRDNAPGLVGWLPLLGIPLDVQLPDTEQTRGLSEEFRKRKLEEVLGDLLDLLLPTPTVMLFDDAHFLDGASADVLARLAGRRDREPWLIVTARAEHGEGWSGPGLPVTSLRLAPLTGADSVRLLEAATEQRPMPRPLISALAARAGGNPLFLESLAQSTDLTGPEAELPESVQDLVTTQVDRLAPADRRVLRYASVLGVQFDSVDLDLLMTGYDLPDAGTFHRLQDFVVRDTGPVLRFRHGLMREVAYEGLPFRTRQRLHARVAEVLEEQDLEGNLELLSLHCFHARQFDKAWSYSTVAARAARAKFANQEAVDLFNRAVEAERRGPRGAVAPAELGTLFEELGDTWFVIGLPDQASSAYRRARKHLADDPVRAARVVAKEARIDQRLRRLPQSLRRVSRALHLLEQQPGRWASSARSLLAMRYAISRLAQGRVEEALDWGQRAARDAEESVDKPTLAQAYATLHGIYVAALREPPLPYGELALQAYTELGDLPHQADCTNNLAVAALDHNRWPEAVLSFGKAAEIYRRIGDTQGEGLASYNQAEVLVRQGRLAEAGTLLTETLRTARSVSDDELVALVLRETGRIACREGDLVGGLEAFERALEVFREIDELEEVPATQLAACEGMLLAGDAAGCLRRLEELDDLDDVLVPAVLRVRGFALLARGDSEAAAEELRAAVAAAREQDDRYSEALSLLGLARVVERTGERDPGAVERAEALLAELGVVAPPVPLPMSPV